MALPDVRADREQRKFIEDADGNVAVRSRAELLGRTVGGVLTVVQVDSSGKLIVTF